MRSQKKGSSRSSKNNLKRKRRIRKFITIVVAIVSLFMIASALLAMAFDDGKKEEAKTGENEINQDAPEVKEEEKEEKINVAIFGVDKEELHTDVVFVASFDPETKKIALVSVPRDTKVKMTDEMLQSLRDRNQFIPTKNGEGVCKFTEVHAYAGPDYANKFSVLQLEDLLGIKVDYYVNVNIKGFRELVDAIGGVDIDVPQDMKYKDPEQDLFINLKAGYQTLDGEKAEQLVRYRDGYVQKDLQRIKMQQDFLKALLKKVTSTETILSNLPGLIKTALDNVETDVTVGDALGYVKYIKDINADNMTMETIPGEGGKFFIHDEEGTKELVDRIFYGKEESEETEGADNTAASDSREYSIEIANGGNTNGLAGKKKDMLAKEGYEIAFVSTYTGDKKENTRIIVKKAGMGEDLLAYFENAEIEADASQLSNGTEIKIILGLNEK